MKPVNIFILTRVAEAELSMRLERQMSKRGRMLKVKSWEMKGLRKFSEELMLRMESGADLCFYYSFVMPKLGKEFDLLRISENSVINVELKSGNISEEAIRKQLLQNHHYLATLGKEIYSYTYISEENRLVKLTSGGKILDASWEQLMDNLRKQENCYAGDVEDLFKEERYLISPLSDPERFLRKEYFLTSQQYDIKRHILKRIQEKKFCYQGFTGLPGTGKSILLYDLAMELSRKHKVCLIHPGSQDQGFQKLEERLRRVDFYCGDKHREIVLKGNYEAIFIDEGHWLTRKQILGICGYAEKEQIPVIIAYDREDVLTPEDRGVWNITQNNIAQEDQEAVQLIESLTGFVKYQLTNRIRVNSELSSFIFQVIKQGKIAHRVHYPSVQLAYADTLEDAQHLLRYFYNQGYCYIRNHSLKEDIPLNEKDILLQSAIGMELDRVMMLVDDSLFYDEDGYLRTRTEVKQSDSSCSAVRCLYHGLNRAKDKIALIVLANTSVFRRILYSIQREE